MDKNIENYFPVKQFHQFIAFQPINKKSLQYRKSAEGFL
jgi:hypothetical protein